MDFVITIGLRKGVNKILFQHRDTSTFLGLSCARVSPHRFLGNEPSSNRASVYGSLGVTAFFRSHELPRLSKLLAATGRETDQTDAIRLLKLRLPRYSPKPSFCFAVVGFSPLALVFDDASQTDRGAPPLFEGSELFLWAFFTHGWIYRQSFQRSQARDTTYWVIINFQALHIVSAPFQIMTGRA